MQSRPALESAPGVTQFISHPALADILTGYIILQYEVAVLRESLSLYTGNRIGII